MTLGSSLLGAVPGLRHAFFSREGGVSTGLYASLNGGLGSNDDPAHVAENRRRMAEHLGVAPAQFLTVFQVHSPDVAVATAPWRVVDDRTGLDAAIAAIGLPAVLKTRREGYDGSLLCAVSPVQQLGAFFERWDAFIDTTGFFAKKLEAIGRHACQIPRPEILDLFDADAGRICGCQTAEPYTVVELSATRAGPLAGEFARSHAFCNAHFMELFFRPESRRVFEAFHARYGRAEGVTLDPPSPARRPRSRRRGATGEARGRS